jgi:tetratricopeptide (TPR) repeat protein
MTDIVKRFCWGVLFAAIAGGMALSASAAEVRASLSTRETYVGLPVTLQLQISDASKIDPPVMPKIDGVDIHLLGTPGRSTRITTINGQTTSSSSLTYAYELTPQRDGNFEIPPITVRADGREQQTRPLNFVASQSETGDLLFVEIGGKEKQIYVGQELHLALKIWLRPFRDHQRQITLSEGDMWKMASERSTWGPFAERMQQLADNDQRPAGKEVLRKDQSGVEHSYYLYEIDATIYPKRTGRIDASDVKVVVEYPTALGKARDPLGGFFEDMQLPGGNSGFFGDDEAFSPFGSRLTVQSVRPIVAQASVEPIDVLPIPTEGRPADYRGAVGRYRIAVEANPTSVKAGDPINLLIGIAGTGPMDLVQAPPLAEFPELAADFKVPSEPLAGFVKDDRKIFSTSIRPRKAGVKQIPGIPFSYFDPQLKKFVTVRSNPISLHVEPADTLALDNIVHRDAAAAKGQRAAAAKSDATAPILTNFSGDEVLRDETPANANSLPLLVLIAAPPIVVLALVIARSWPAASSLVGRFGSSIRRSKDQIQAAQNPREIAAVLHSYLCRCFGMDAASTTSAGAAGELRSRGYRDLAIRCERLFAECEPGAVMFGKGRTLVDLKQDATRFVDDLQTECRRPRPKPAASRTPIKSRRHLSSLQSSTTSAVIILALASAMFGCGRSSIAADHAGLSLTLEQQETLLAEANNTYAKGLKAAAKDSADAKQAFTDAAEKFQLLVNSGIKNSRLYFNLANAYLESGQPGRAVANYHRALRLDPTNRQARTNLAYAEGLLKPRPDAPEVNRKPIQFVDYVSVANDWMSRYASPHTTPSIAIVAWLALWAAIGLRAVRVHFPWKSLAAASIVICFVAGASYFLNCQELNRNLAVVVSTASPLRAGDGENFASTDGVHLQEGSTVELLKQRGDWLQVRTQNDQTGWLPRQAVEII